MMHMSRQARFGAIATLAVLCVSSIAAAGAVLLDIAVLAQHPQPPLSAGWSGVLPGAAMLIPGLLLLWRRPQQPIAWVLSVFGTLWVLDGLASAAVNYAWYFDREAWWAVPAFWFFSRFGSVLLLPLVLLLVLFPDGRLRSGWRAVASWLAIGLGLVMPFSSRPPGCSAPMTPRAPGLSLRLSPSSPHCRCQTRPGRFCLWLARPALWQPCSFRSRCA